MSCVITNKAMPQAALYAAPTYRPTEQPFKKARKLSPKQLQLPFFQAALSTLKSIKTNKRSLLPRLLYKSDTGRETRSEVYESLSLSAEPILARLDLATGVLGWVDNQGMFRLNNQKGIAKDAGITTSSFNRLITALSECGYIHKRSEKINVKDRQYGTLLVRTRVFIRFTDLFFRHLQLSFKYGLARKSARKRRTKQLNALLVINMQNEASNVRSKQITAKKKEAFKIKQATNDELREQNKARLKAERMHEIACQRPDITPAQMRQILDSEFS